MRVVDVTAHESAMADMNAPLDDTQETAARVRHALGQARTFNRSPHHLATPLTEPVEVCETHISWVALAGNYAYKLKKPVHFDFLDYSTLERRRVDCEFEVTLNRRWAPELYLGLSELVQTTAGLFFDVPGQVVEYAVRMRRFSRAEQLDSLLIRKAISSAELGRFGEFIALIHSQVSNTQTPKVDPREMLRRALQAIEGLRDHRPSNSLDELAHWLRTEWQGISGLLQRRSDHGRVVECHGDLHCGNVVRIAGRLIPFDGIEFDRSLRCIDVASDIAFLIMDLLAKDRPDLAAEFLTAWLEHALDYEAVQPLGFFIVYRALIRALIGELRAHQLDSTQSEERRRIATPYLRFARDWPHRPKGSVVLMHGFSGSGKSVLAAGLVSALPAVRVRADALRKSPFAAAAPEGRYAAATIVRAYQQMGAVTRSLACAGFNVVVDATFLDPDQRKAFASLCHEFGGTIAIVSCTAPHAVLEGRLRLRRDDPSDATQAVLALQLSQYSPLDAAELAVTVTVNTATSVDVAAVADQVRRILRQQSHVPRVTVAGSNEPLPGQP